MMRLMVFLIILTSSAFIGMAQAEQLIFEDDFTTPGIWQEQDDNEIHSYYGPDGYVIDILEPGTELQFFESPFPVDDDLMLDAFHARIEATVQSDQFVGISWDDGFTEVNVIVGYSNELLVLTYDFGNGDDAVETTLYHETDLVDAEGMTSLDIYVSNGEIRIVVNDVEVTTVNKLPFSIATDVGIAFGAQSPSMIQFHRFLLEQLE